MSTIKVDTIQTRTGSGNITASNNIAGNLVGDVTGNTTGTHTGNIATNSITTQSGTDITIPTGKKLVVTDSGGLAAPGTQVQIVQVDYTHGGTTQNSNTWTNTGLVTCAITPKLAGSKILLDAGGFVLHVNGQAANWGGAWSFYRDVAGGGYANVVSGGRFLMGYYRNNQTTDHWDDYIGVMQWLDTPSYTLGQTITYQVWGRKASRNSSGTYIHHTGGIIGSNGISANSAINMRAIEIAQ